MSLANDCIVITDALPVDSSLTIPNVVFDDATITQAQAAGFTIAVPALEATWDAPTNVFVVGIQFEYKSQDGTYHPPVTATQPASNLKWITADGILPEKVYSCRWRAVGLAAVGEWSAWTDVTILTGFSGLAGEDGVVSSSDIINFLNMLRLNLWPFGLFSVAGGASLVDPFTDPPVTGADSDQLRAIAFPGNDATVRARVTDRVFGLAATDGAAYNISFDAYLVGGGVAATLKARFTDSLGGAITGIADETFAVTNVRQTFSWLNVKSDDPDFGAAQPNNAIFEFFVSAAGDIPAGSTLYITNFQIQNGDAFTPSTAIDLPWRPNIDEDNLLAYAEYILEAFRAELAAKPNMRMQSAPEGKGYVLAPFGVTRVISITGTAYALGSDGPLPSGAYLRPENAALTTITFTPEATHGLKPFSVIAIRAHGAGLFVVSAGVGVTINPASDGSTDASAQYDVRQYLYLGGDVWDTI